jgi:hypothetical protein
VTITPGADGGPTLACIRDFQIVNGGQTTASIFHAIKKEKKHLPKKVPSRQLERLASKADLQLVRSALTPERDHRKMPIKSTRAISMP